jgi:AcrR family transcriptional regulator
MVPNDPTKARLLEAAGDEFAAKGFEQATVRSIAQKANANIAAINYHFGDKHQLYLHALREAHHCSAVEMPPDEAFFVGAPADQLRRYIRHFFETMLAIRQQDGDWRHALILREMLRPTAAFGSLARDVIRPKFERLIRILEQIRPEADPKHLHATAFSIIGQCLFYRFARRVAEQLVGAEELASFDLDFLTDHVTNFSLAALGLAPSGKAQGRSAKVRAARRREEASWSGSP